MMTYVAVYIFILADYSKETSRKHITMFLLFFLIENLTWRFYLIHEAHFRKKQANLKENVNGNVKVSTKKIYKKNDGNLYK